MFRFIFLLVLAVPALAQSVIYGPENFDSIAVGSTPPGWVFAAGVGGKSTPLTVTTYGASSAPSAFGFATAPNDDEAIWTTTPSQNAQILFTQRVNKNAQGAGASFGLIFESDAAGLNQIAVVLNFLGNTNSGSSIQLASYARTDGAFAQLTNTTLGTFNFTDGDFVTVRAQMVQSIFSFRIWKANTPEPATWSYSASNTLYKTGNGFNGFYISGSNAPLAADEPGSVDDVTITELTPLPAQLSSPLPVTTTNWYFSPYSTYSDGSGAMQVNNILPSSTKAIWTTPGSYFKVGFTGSSFLLNLDESNMTSGADAVLIWSVDSGPWLTYTLSPPAENSIQIAFGLASVNHTLVVYLKASDFQSDRWVNNPPTQAVQIVSAQTDKGAQLIAPFGPIAQGSRNWMFLGDSITEGHHTLADGLITLTSDSTQVWTHSVALAFNAEYGNMGHGGLGWVQTASDGTPALPTSYSDYFNQHARVYGGKFAPIPDAVVVNLGTIDGTADTTAAVRTFLASIRENVNAATPIYMVVPFGQFQAGNIESVVAASGDRFAFIVNLGLAASYGLSDYTNTPTQNSYDGLHPSAAADAWLGAEVVDRINQLRFAKTIRTE